MPLLMAWLVIFGGVTFFPLYTILSESEGERTNLAMMQFPVMLAITLGILFLTVKLYKKWKPDLKID